MPRELRQKKHPSSEVKPNSSVTGSLTGGRRLHILSFAHYEVGSPMIKLEETLRPEGLLPKFRKFWELSARKILSIEKSFDPSTGSPVYTVEGRYTSRGWTEWTQGFQFGSAILQFDATGDEKFLQLAKERTLKFMPPHITHTGVHDHGFNNISTYGNLLRLITEGRISASVWERRLYELALKCSAGVQASRWTSLPEGGYIYSFNGSHSLFVDTIRTLRVLALGHLLGHRLLAEGDREISLLERLITHCRTTTTYSIYYGEGRDIYDICGRVAHESIFNTNDGSYRCPNSQQGYSPFTTWTRGLAWAICGFAEILEFIEALDQSELEPFGGREPVEGFILRGLQATSDFYIENTPTDGIPYWDTGAPGLAKLGNYLDRPADPFNDLEPVDSSAAAIASQGLLRFGYYLSTHGRDGSKYWLAGLRVVSTLLDEPYLSTDPSHQGLILHSVYHRPRGWDHIPPGRRVPCGESSMWGDYHIREATLYLQRIAQNQEYLRFWGKLREESDDNR